MVLRHLTDKLGRWARPELWIGLAVLVAIALRLAHLWQLVSADPLLLQPVVDAQAYDEWARRIVQDPWGQQVFFQSPGYPYLLALIYALWGPDPLHVAVVQSLLGGLSVWLVGRVGRRMDIPHAPWVGAMAAWMLALFAPLVFYDPLLLKVEVTITSSLLCLYLYLRALQACRRGSLWALGAGLISAWLVLLRGNFLLALPLLAGWLLFEPLLPPANGSPRAPAPTRWRRGVCLAGAYLLGCALLLGWVGLRNYRVGGQWVFSNAATGHVLYIGNNPYSPLGEYKRLPFLRAHPRFEREDLQAEAERRVGRPLTLQQASRFWRDQALAFMVERPGLALRRVIYKLGRVVESYESGDNYNFAFHRSFSLALRLPYLSWAWLLGLAAAALLSLRRHYRAWMPILIIAGAYLATLLLFFVRSRYRIPLVPFIALLAACELLSLGALLRSRRWVWLSGHAAILLAVASTSLVLGHARAAGDPMGWWQGSLAVAHMQRDDCATGHRLAQQALARQPDHAAMLQLLGRGYLRCKRDPLAAQLCGRAVELQPQIGQHRECLALALWHLQQADRGLRVLLPALRGKAPLQRYLLGTALAEAQGDRPRAIRLLQQAARHYPTAPEIRAHLARLRGTRSRGTGLE